MKSYEVISLTSKGGRDENQDATDYAVTNNNELLCVVADGLGGHQGGRIASHVATTAIIDQAKQGFSFSQEGLHELLQLAQDTIAIKQKENTDLEEMRSTIVLLAIQNGKALWIYCGDSRLYHIRDGRILSQTKDHSVPMTLVATEEISLDQVRYHPDRNKLLWCLGGKEDKLKTTTVKNDVEIFPGDVFLLCTDGFWEYVLEEEMLHLWQGDLDKWLQSMQQYLLKKAEPNHDNYTVCAVRVAADACTIYKEKKSNSLLTTVKKTQSFWVKTILVSLSLVIIFLGGHVFIDTKEPEVASITKEIHQENKYVDKDYRKINRQEIKKIPQKVAAVPNESETVECDLQAELPSDPPNITPDVVFNYFDVIPIIKDCEKVPAN